MARPGDCRRGRNISYCYQSRDRKHLLWPDWRFAGSARPGRNLFSLPHLVSSVCIGNFCILGWFIGQGRATIAFVVQIFLNLTNMGLGALFVLSLGMEADGVGLSALIAEVSAALLGGVLVAQRLGKLNVRVTWNQIWDRTKVVRTLGANGDIMIRTLCLVFAFAWFTSRGARAGDVTIAANAVLLNFFEVAAYLIDGFAYASEALVGQSIGAKNRERFNRAIHLTTLWAIVVGACCSAIIWFAGPWLIDLMTVNPEVRRNRSALYFLDKPHAIARHNMFSIRWHLHWHGHPRNAQHDGALTCDLPCLMVVS